MPKFTILRMITTVRSNHSWRLLWLWL